MKKTIDLDNPEVFSPAERGYTIKIIIESFRGYKDVEVHLFRPQWNKEEENNYEWNEILGDPINPTKPFDPLDSRKVLLETFTFEEKEKILDYLLNRYSEHLKSIKVDVLNFPIPLGLVPLSSIEPRDNIGIIEFEKIPNYTLPFPVHGLYILNKEKLIK